MRQFDTSAAPQWLWERNQSSNLAGAYKPMVYVEPKFANPTNRKPFKTLVNVAQDCPTNELWKTAWFLIVTALKRWGKR